MTTKLNRKLSNKWQYFLISASRSSKSSSVTTFFFSSAGSKSNAGACSDTAIENKRMLPYARNSSKMIAINPRKSWQQNLSKTRKQSEFEPSIWKIGYGCIKDQSSLFQPSRSNVKDSAPVGVAASLPCRFFCRICLNNLQMISPSLSIKSPKLKEKPKDGY